jgi:hypothetical protein
VQLQRLGNDGAWTAVATDDDYTLQTWLEIYHVRTADPYLPGTTPGCNELADQIWSTRFQPAYDFRTGTYRFVSSGVFRTAPTIDEAYETTSEPFEVAPAVLEITDLRVDAGTDEVSFRVAYPNGPDAWRWRPAEATEGMAEVTAGTSVAAAYDPAAGLWRASLPVEEGSDVEVTFADPWGNTATWFPS